MKKACIKLSDNNYSKLVILSLRLGTNVNDLAISIAHDIASENKMTESNYRNDNNNRSVIIELSDIMHHKLRLAAKRRKMTVSAIFIRKLIYFKKSVDT